jgi:hypothetical protein
MQKRYLPLVATISSLAFGAEDAQNVDPHITRVARAIVAARLSDDRKETVIDRFRVISTMLNDELIEIAEIIEQDAHCSAEDLFRFNQALQSGQGVLMNNPERVQQHVQRTSKLFDRFFAYEARLMPALKPYVDQLEKQEQQSFQGLSPEIYRARIEQQNQFEAALTQECTQEMGNPLQRAIDAITQKSFFVKCDSDTDSDDMV